ncbi:MAG: transcriptional regulator [Desulfobacterota bacterium]|nr:transcriptional regulator [Thermodesulfobacteriota bacterium]MDW8001377.1 transcriptional regulator [Deltaproteobacteria bacterium]
MGEAEKEELEPRTKTLRQDIIEALKVQSMSLREISKAVGIPESEVLSHLGHIKKTIAKLGYVLEVSPAQCLSCGFIFKKRDRLKKPGKCPSCRSTFIEPQIFNLKKNK